MERIASQIAEIKSKMEQIDELSSKADFKAHPSRVEHKVYEDPILKV